MFDQDGNGRISHDELKNVLGGNNNSQQDEKYWKDMIKEVDQNGDGEIDFEEFSHFMGLL